MEDIHIYRQTESLNFWRDVFLPDAEVKDIHYAAARSAAHLLGDADCLTLLVDDHDSASQSVHGVVAFCMDVRHQCSVAVEDCVGGGVLLANAFVANCVGLKAVGDVYIRSYYRRLQLIPKR